MSDCVSRVTCFSSEKVMAQIEQRRRGDRKIVRHGGALCSRCLEKPPANPKGGYCASCHAEYEATRRKSEREELKRLRALEQILSKGKDNGQSKTENTSGAT